MKGFTLIEVLLYAVIFLIVVGGMMLLAFAMLTATQRATTQVEVADNARFMIQKMQRTIQGATSINYLSGSSILVDTGVADPTVNPVIIDIVDGVLRIKRGTNPQIPITNSLVTISDVFIADFTNAPPPGTKNSFHFKVLVSSVDPYRPASTSVDLFISTQ